MITRDADDECLVHDLQAYANLESYFALADMTKDEINPEKGGVLTFIMLYDKQHKFTGTIWAPKEHVENLKKIWE